MHDIQENAKHEKSLPTTEENKNLEKYLLNTKPKSRERQFISINSVVLKADYVNPLMNGVGKFSKAACVSWSASSQYRNKSVLEIACVRGDLFDRCVAVAKCICWFKKMHSIFVNYMFVPSFTRETFSSRFTRTQSKVKHLQIPVRIRHHFKSISFVFLLICSLDCLVAGPNVE